MPNQSTRIRRPEDSRPATPLALTDLHAQGTIDALANAFDDRTAAEIVLSTIGFPATALPGFDDGSYYAWWRICKQIADGLTAGGLEALLRAACEKYPFNRNFCTDRGQHQPVPPPVLPSARKLIAFLCHSSILDQRLQALYHWLAGAGCVPWFDQIDILPGQSRSREKAAALARSHVVIACLSAPAIERHDRYHEELAPALAADPQGAGSIFVIPVRLERDLPLPEVLADLQPVDFPTGEERLRRALERRKQELRSLGDG